MTREVHGDGLKEATNYEETLNRVSVCVRVRGGYWFYVTLMRWMSMVKGRGKECKVSKQTCIKLPIVNKISLFRIAVGGHKHLRGLVNNEIF